MRISISSFNTGAFSKILESKSETIVIFAIEHLPISFSQRSIILIIIANYLKEEAAENVAPELAQAMLYLFLSKNLLQQEEIPPQINSTPCVSKKQKPGTIPPQGKG